MCKYKIITFDSGGIRGLLSAILLKRLNDKFPQLICKTDFFAGTSIGSLLALGLAYGLSIEKLINVFVENGKYIFESPCCDTCRPKYNNANLIKVLKCIMPDNPRLMDLEKHVLAASFEVIGEQSTNWKPVFYNNFCNSPNKCEKVIDTALYSSAAPGYFPSYKNKVDGGVIAYNPSMAAISTAVDKYAGNQKLDEIYLLSIGTGLNNLINKFIRLVDISKWGSKQWHKLYILEAMMLDGSIETNCLYSSQLLGNRYFRLNPYLPKPILLDNYKEIPCLINIAQNFDIEPAEKWIKENWF